MYTPKQSLFQAVLARLSFGAVPVDGSYWFDRKDAGNAGAVQAKSRERAAIPDWSPVSISLSGPWRRS